MIGVRHCFNSLPSILQCWSQRDWRRRCTSTTRLGGGFMVSSVKQLPSVLTFLHWTLWSTSDTVKSTTFHWIGYFFPIDKIRFALVISYIDMIFTAQDFISYFAMQVFFRKRSFFSYSFSLRKHFSLIFMDWSQNVQTIVVILSKRQWANTLYFPLNMTPVMKICAVLLG